LGVGVTVKKYRSGFDPNSEFSAKVLRLLDAQGAPWQTQTPKVNMGGGAVTLPAPRKA